MPSMRYHAVDALRGIAAFLVMVHHYTLHYAEEFGYTTVTFPAWFESFRYGPHFFFMISGFVIFMTLDRHDRFLSFMRARLLRLLPAYWAVIPFSALVAWWAAPDELVSAPIDLVINALFLQGVLDTKHVDGVYWSLLVEMAFYLLAGAFVIRLGLGRHIVPMLWAWLAIALVGMIAYNDWPFPLNLLVQDILISYYAFYFVAGVVLYLAVKEGWLRQGHKWLLAVCSVLMVLVVPLPYGLVVAGLIWVLWAAIQGKLDQLLCHRPLLWLGTLSYPLYLVHFVAGMTLIHNLVAAGVPELAAILASMVLSILLAQLIHSLIERPAWRFFGRKR